MPTPQTLTYLALSDFPHGQTLLDLGAEKLTTHDGMSLYTFDEVIAEVRFQMERSTQEELSDLLAHLEHEAKEGTHKNLLIAIE